MKKYKLSKWYPGLPVSWKNREVIASNLGHESGYIVNHDLTTCIYSPAYIENNPEFWQPVQEPLFVSEDGVEIYEGMKTTVVSKKDFSTGPDMDNIGMYPNKFWYFSTLESAEKYVRLNKPRYSLRQVYEYIDENPVHPYVDIDEIETNLEDYKY
jgi:hypothetical protein